MPESSPVAFQDGKPVINNDQSASPSPTGRPLISPAAVPWLLAVAVGAASGLEVAIQAVPDPTAQLAMRIAQSALLGALGILSPGWRKK